MHLVLVPGAWLNGSSWDAVVPALETAGHTVNALTLPGMASRDTDRSQIRLADQVAAVVAALDAAPGPVVLVGHSIGSSIAHAALDARPEAVARIVHLGGFPAADGKALLADLPATNGEVVMPDWIEMGEEANVVDFGESALAAFYSAAIPAPAQVLQDPIRLSDERRFLVPATLICPEYTADDVRDWLSSGALPELEKTAQVDYVDLPGGHWPQLTQPEALAAVLLEIAAR